MEITIRKNASASFFWKKVLTSLASLKLALCNIALAFLLVAIGTLFQIHSGAIEAQEKIFQSFFIYWEPKSPMIRIPIFPGGYLLGVSLVLNMTTSMIVYPHLSIRKLGIYLIHFGVILLLLGESLAGIFSKETILPITVGEKVNYSMEIRKAELAIETPHNREIVFHEKQLFAGNQLSHPSLPFALLITKKVDNVDVGPNLSISEIPASRKDNEMNFPTAWVEMIDSSKGTLKSCVLSSVFEKPEEFHYLDQDFKLSLRPRRHYFPFWVELLEFNHINHPGTTIPKTFSSHIQICSNFEEILRSALISMNTPLRYQGKTFYQAGFGGNRDQSIFKIVSNPVSKIPYFSFFLIVAGFVYHLLGSFLIQKGSRN